MAGSKNLKIIPVVNIQDVFVGNKKYYELTKGKLKLKDLASYSLLFQKLSSNTRVFLNKHLKSKNIELKHQLEVVSYNLIMVLVKAKFVIWYATKEFIESELNNKELYEIEVIPKIPKRFIELVIMEKSIPNYSVRKLIDMVK